ncbi:site-specific integrase [Deinococcus cavernae]|uniref:Site-specific integrase n=1 Tax=Deinococcus cavernae TaxID=2320857 RepID=A0A418V5V3_9DEIO|nr:site-specific integrase [Deinococcus cavernae]RJF71493.1 site-specific integrase [Deinococcus cavernae]
MSARLPAGQKKPRRRRGSGEGSIHQLPNGRYRWQTTVGHDRDGKQVRRSGTARTRKEADRKLTEVKAAHQKGLLSLPSTTTLGEWLDIWLMRRRPHLAVGTYEQYVLRLKHVPVSLRRTRLQELKRTQVREFASDLITRGLAATTRSKVISHLRAALEAAVEEELLALNPALGVRITSTVAERSKQQSRRKALTLDELQAFLDAAREDPLYSLYYVLFSLGLRRGEALGLRWQDVNLKTGEIRIEQQVKVEGNKAVIGSLKTVNSRRRLQASEDLLEVLQARQAYQRGEKALVGDAWKETGLVFTSSIGTMLHPRNVNRSISKVCAAAGLPNFSSHSARHTHITQRLRAGEKLEVVSAIAGHATPSITINTYRHVGEDEKRSSVFSLKERLEKSHDP